MEMNELDHLYVMSYKIGEISSTSLQRWGATNDILLFTEQDTKEIDNEIYNFVKVSDLPKEIRYELYNQEEEWS
jgi:hypothetical protein